MKFNDDDDDEFGKTIEDIYLLFHFGSIEEGKVLHILVLFMHRIESTNNILKWVYNTTRN